LKKIIIYVIIMSCGFIFINAQQNFNREIIFKNDDQGRPLYHKDRIYVKIKKDVWFNAVKKEGAQNSYLNIGIKSVDNIFAAYGIENIERTFRLNSNLPDKVKDRMQKNGNHSSELSRIYTIKTSPSINLPALLRELNNNENIEYAEPVPFDYPLEIPNDTLYAQCQHLPQIMAEEAWEIFKGEQSDSTIMIGICDTGTDWNHEDLTDNLWQNLAEDANGNGETIIYDDSLKMYILDPGDLNGIDDDNNGFVDDLIGWDFLQDYETDTQGNNPLDFNNHGTHVAGIAAGVTNNSIGIASISWNVKFVPTSHSDTTFNNILRGYEGIVYLAELGCDVVNCSWGGGGYSRTHAEAVAYANSLGTIIVVAAGNGNSSSPFYPSAYPNLISVASVASSDKKSSYSNYGNHVDISAPGGDGTDGGILSCIRNGGYRKFMGTSMASPVVAGVFGFVKAYHPDWTNEQIKKQVIGTADFIDTLNPNYINMLGSGRVNPYRALTETNVSLSNTLKLDLINVEPDDSTDNANHNKALEPGENIRLGFLIRNYAVLTGSENTTLTLTSYDENIEIIEGTYNAKFVPDGFTEIPKIFEIRISETAKSGFITLTLNAESEDSEILLGSSMDFELPVNAGGILVWEGIRYGRGSSGAFISEFLSDQGIENIYTNTYPVSMVGFDAVFLSFGSIGSGLKSAAMNDWMADDIIDYLESGGKLYLETMDGLGWDQQNNKKLFSLIGIDSSDDGSDKIHVVDSLFGGEGSICEGLYYWRSNISGYQSVDRIYPNENGIVALDEPLYGKAAVQNTGEHGQKTFISIYPVAHFYDRVHPNTRYELIKRIMNFFEIPMEYTVPRFSYNPKTGHAPLEVSFNEISYTSIDAVGWKWDFEGKGIDEEQKIKNPKWTYIEPGDYNPIMTVDNGILEHSTTNSVYIFDGESAVNFNMYQRGIVSDTNLNIRNAFTLEAWIYPVSLGQAYWGRIFDKNNIIFMCNNQNRLSLILTHDTSKIKTTEIWTSPESLIFNTWQHVAASYDGDTTFKIYINGKEMELNYYRGPGNGCIRDNKTNALTIGNRESYGRGFEGRIDEVRVWNKVRTSGEIQSSMFRKLSGKENGLLLYWQFQEGNGNSSEDKSQNKRDCLLNADWRQGIHESRILKHPQSQSVCEEWALELYAEVIKGGDSLIFNWLKDGRYIQWATENPLKIKKISPDDEGDYKLMVKNYYTDETEFTKEAKITVELLPVITLQPAKEKILEEGAILELNVEAEGDGEISYEWLRNGESLNVFEATYIDSNLTLSDSGYYYCSVSNHCGEVISNSCNVSVISGIDDLFDNGLELKILPNPTDGNAKAIMNIPKCSIVEIRISDCLGNELYSTQKEVNTAGELSFILPTGKNRYSSGIYYLTVRTEDRIINKSFVVIK
jgi:subtilisin family serine protease/PKD repeat protein